MPGNLILSSGKLVACDPFDLDKGAFVTPVPVGTFPVHLSLVVYPDGDRRVAAAMLRFSDAMPEVWRAAQPAGLRPDQVSSGGYPCYSVESGTGCFVDEAVVDAWYAASGFRADEYSPDFWIYLEKWNDRLREEFEASGDKACTIDMSHLYPGNIIVFESGWGDGGYPSFFGYDLQQHLVCVVTDFRVIGRQ
jgi:hypothetical protein